MCKRISVIPAEELSWAWATGGHTGKIVSSSCQPLRIREYMCSPQEGNYGTQRRPAVGRLGLEEGKETWDGWEDHSFSFIFKLYSFVFVHLCTYFRLCWVSVAARRLSLAAAGGGSSWLQLMDFSSQWLLLLCSVEIGHPAYFISE